MRYLASQAQEKAYRIIGLSTSLADYTEVAEWLGVPPENTYNFHSSVRPNPV